MGGGNLEEEDYYHGLLPREDIPHLLINEGDFLVRLSETAPHQPRQIIISVLVEKPDNVRHIVVQQNLFGKYLTDARWSFDNVPDLIQFYITNADPVISTVPNAILKKPIARAPWELRHEAITIEKKLGEGAFGEVFSGKYKLPAGRVVDVAVKLAKTAEMSKDKIKEMMKEARLMRNYEHPNVVRMYGVCVEHEPLLIVMELVDGGALDEFLRKQKVTVKDKIEKMVAGGAWGLEYLHSRNCIHRDIAARNCLLARNGVIKISDFGLSREGDEYQMTKARRVPIKWLAPETIQRLIYNSKTDVWSYGVMVWEIFADAEEPYPGMTNAQVKEKVTNGYKMPLSSDAPAWIVHIVHHSCWDVDPVKRATMAQIARLIEQNAGLTAPVLIGGPFHVVTQSMGTQPVAVSVGMYGTFPLDSYSNISYNVVINPSDPHLWEQIVKRLYSEDKWALSMEDYERLRVSKHDVFNLVAAVREGSSGQNLLIGCVASQSYRMLDGTCLTVIGLYFVEKAYRGRGIGMNIFTKLISLSPKTDNFALNSVPSMITSYYCRVGYQFMSSFRWLWLRASFSAINSTRLDETSSYGTIILRDNYDDENVEKYCRKVAPAIDRSEYLMRWMKQRCCWSLVAKQESGDLLGFGVARIADANQLVIGPLYADDEVTASRLLQKLLNKAKNVGSLVTVEMVVPSSNISARNVFATVTGGNYQNGPNDFLVTMCTRNYIVLNLQYLYAITDYDFSVA